MSQTSLKKKAPAVLTCNASSPLQVKITWFKNGKPIKRRYGSQLKIDSFQYEDQGDYYCSFSTHLTSSLSKPALLVLEGLFSDKPAYVSLNLNNEALFIICFQTALFLIVLCFLFRIVLCHVMSCQMSNQSCQVSNE